MFIELLISFIADLAGMKRMVAAGILSVLLSSLIYLVSGIVSRIIFKTYSTLKMEDQHRWNSGINRSICGFIMATWGLNAWWNGPPQGDVMFGADTQVDEACAFALGFFVFEVRDSLNMYLAHGIVEETLAVHHMIGIMLFTTVLYTSSYRYLSVFALVQEIVHPCVHFGWLLTKCGMDCEPIWAANQYLLICTWIVFRSGCDICLWYYLVTALPNMISGPLFPALFCICGTILLSVYLNPHWLKIKFIQLAKRNRKVARLHQRAEDEQ